MSRPIDLDLTVNVPADEWAYCQRRLAYLETLLLRVMRERASIQEWYDAAELAALRLPGLPAGARAIGRKAAAGQWLRRRCAGQRGQHRFAYHVTSLPRRAFDALIARILDLPAIEAELPPTLPDIEPGAPDAVAELAFNTAPPWVLPLLRLMKGEAGGDLGRAWHALPTYLPAGTSLPTVSEAASVLVNLGLADRMLR